MSKKFAALKTRAEQIAEERKALEEAEKAHRKAIDDALKHAGRARVEFVEKLYDFFGIEPETTERTDKEGKVVRDGQGRPVMVKSDRSETRRIARLDEALASLLDGSPQTVSEAESTASSQAPATPVQRVEPLPRTPHGSQGMTA